MNSTPIPQLSNPALLRTQLFISGEWCDAQNRETLEVTDPATGGLIARVADADLADLERAIRAADAAQKPWAALTARQRGDLLRQWYQLVVENQEDLAQLLTWEQGKPLAEARGEIAYGASYIEWFAEEAKRIYGDLIAPPDADTRLVTLKQPVGVVGIITPWNFPCAMLARKMAPALAAGCTLVAKPASETPLSALALAYLAELAGVPSGVINLLPSTRAAELGELLCRHPRVRKLSFTGSTQVGSKLIAQIAPEVKRLTLELGGNAPFVVFADADLAAAVDGALASKFRNAGQTCVCANRFYIHAAVYDEFLAKLKAQLARLHLGAGLDCATDIGPLISSRACKKVASLVQSALAQGAKMVFELPVPEKLMDVGHFYPLQVLSEVPHDADIVRQEIFGPVVVLIRFDDEAQLLAQVNDTPYGLAGYFYTRDYSRIWRFAEAVETGMLGINTGLISNAMAPFGGVKQSGWGREGSRYGLDDFLDIKYLCMALD